MNFFGSQFQDESNKNIDPVLRAYSNSQRFERDVEIATATPVDNTPERQQLKGDAMSFESAPRTPPRALNPEATSFHPPPPQESWPPTQPFRMVSGRRQPNQQTPEWRSSVALRDSSRQLQTPISINSRWQSNNLFARLSPDWTEPQQSYYQNQQTHMGQWTSQRVSDRIDLYPTPPDTGEYNGVAFANIFDGQVLHSAAFPSGYNTTPAPIGRNGTTLSFTNVSTLPTNITPSEDLAQWNRQSYNLGDRTRHESLAPPPKPTPGIRNRGRGSAATSLSVNALACETCGMAFEKKHELE